MSRGCPSPRRPPSELGGEVPALTSCLPPRSRLLHLYAAVFFGSSSSINISRFRFLLSLSVFEAPAFGRHLCTGVVSVCFGGVWQWGDSFLGIWEVDFYSSVLLWKEKLFEKYQTVSAGFRDLLSNLLRVLFCRYFPHRCSQPRSSKGPLIPGQLAHSLAPWPAVIPITLF